MIPLFLAVLTASLLGSLHCAGMCGPFCGVAVSGGKSSSTLHTVALHGAYHGGRLVTYALLGAAAGSVGALVDLTSTLAGLQPIALALAGSCMVLIGVGEIARLRGWKLSLAGWQHFRLPSGWTRLIQQGQRFAAKQSGIPRALTIGLLTTLLPCGWLYAFVLTAAGSGGPLFGAGVMAAFWLGTLPVLLSLGIGARQLAGALGERLPMVTAVALVLVGCFTLTNRMSLSPEVLAATVTQDAEASQLNGLVNPPDPNAVPACCRERLEGK